jgi:WD40 repeat protein
VAEGVATVTLLFDAWKEGQVTPTTHNVKISKPKAGPQPQPVSSRLVRSLIHPDRTANQVTLKFSPDGTKLFTAGYPSGVLQVWDVVERKELCRIETPPGYRGTSDYAFPAPDLVTVCVTREKSKVVEFERDEKKQRRFEYSGGVTVWDLESGNKLFSLETSAPGRGVLAAYRSPDGDKLVTVERPSYLSSEEVTDQTVLHDLKAKTVTPLADGYGMAAFTPDGQALVLCVFATRTEPSRLKVIDLADKKERFAVTSDTKGRGFSWPVVSPDGKLVAVDDGRGRIDSPATLRLFDLKTGHEAMSFKSGGDYPFMEPVFSPDSRRLVATDYNGGLSVWDLASKKVEQERKFPEMQLVHPTFAPDGKSLAVFVRPKIVDRDPDYHEIAQPQVYLFDVTNREKKPDILVCPHGWMGALAFSPDGKTLAAGSAGAVHLFDLSKE